MYTVGQVCPLFGPGLPSSTVLTPPSLLRGGGRLEWGLCNLRFRKEVRTSDGPLRLTPHKQTHSHTCIH